MGFAARLLNRRGGRRAGFGLPDIGLLNLTEMAERARMLDTGAWQPCR